MKDTDEKTLNIEAYSDVVCPWCYIGKRRLEDGLKLLDAKVRHEVVWKAFELNPHLPVEGLDRHTYRVRKFGSWERSLAKDHEVAANGATVGLKFHFQRIERTPNTFLAHRLLWLAHQEGRQDELKEALMHAYFTEGRDVGQAETLAVIAREAGMNAEKVAAFLDGDEGATEVREEERQARSIGVDGVPFFIVNGVPALSGAQLPATFAEVFRNALQWPGGGPGDHGALG